MRRYMVTLLVAFVFIILGIVFSIYDVFSYNIESELLNNDLTVKETIYDVTFNNKDLEVVGDYTDVEVVYSNTIAKGSAKIAINYYDELMNVDKLTINQDDKDIVYLSTDDDVDSKAINKVFNLTINALKDKIIYRYDQIFKPKVKVYINIDDKDIVKIRN